MSNITGKICRQHKTHILYSVSFFAKFVSSVK